MKNLNTLFNYPEVNRKATYTKDEIESMNRVIRKAIKERKLFPSDDSAKKVIYLAIMDVSKMDHANQQLESGHEPFYEGVRRPLVRVTMEKEPLQRFHLTPAPSPDCLGNTDLKSTQVFLHGFPIAGIPEHCR